MGGKFKLYIYEIITWIYLYGYIIYFHSKNLQNLDVRPVPHRQSDRWKEERWLAAIEGVSRRDLGKVSVCIQARRWAIKYIWIMRREFINGHHKSIHFTNFNWFIIEKITRFEEILWSQKTVWRTCCVWSPE